MIQYSSNRTPVATMREVSNTSYVDDTEEADNVTDDREPTKLTTVQRCDGGLRMSQIRGKR